MNSLRVCRLAAAAVLLLVTPAASLTAQDPQPFHALAFTTGATFMSVDAVNAQLKNAQFAGLSNDGISYGINTYFAFSRAILGADFAFTTFGEEGTASGRTDDLNSKTFLATISYAFVTTEHVTAFPTLGIGTGTFDVTLRDRSATPATTQSQPTFAELAAAPGSAVTVSGNHLLFSVGGGVDYLVMYKGLGEVGVVFGIRAGVQVAPNRTTWTARGNNVLAGPDASAQGPFLRLLVGIGGR